MEKGTSWIDVSNCTVLYIKLLFCRFKEVKMQKVLWEVAAYLVFLYLLMTVAYGTRDPMTNRVYDHYQNMFSKGSYDYQHNNSWGTWDISGVRFFGFNFLSSNNTKKPFVISAIIKTEQTQ